MGMPDEGALYERVSYLYRKCSTPLTPYHIHRSLMYENPGTPVQPNLPESQSTPISSNSHNSCVLLRNDGRILFTVVAPNPLTPSTV